MIRALWMKWSSTLEVLSHRRIPIILKGKFYKTSYALNFGLLRSNIFIKCV